MALMNEDWRCATSITELITYRPGRSLWHEYWFGAKSKKLRHSLSLCIYTYIYIYIYVFLPRRPRPSFPSSCTLRLNLMLDNVPHTKINVGNGRLPFRRNMQFKNLWRVDFYRRKMSYQEGLWSNYKYILYAWKWQNCTYGNDKIVRMDMTKQTNVIEWQMMKIEISLELIFIFYSIYKINKPNHRSACSMSFSQIICALSVFVCIYRR